jgi:hypothetical protein
VPDWYGELKSRVRFWWDSVFEISAKGSLSLEGKSRLACVVS